MPFWLFKGMGCNISLVGFTVVIWRELIVASKLEEDQESLVATLIDKEDGGKATRKKKVVSRLGSTYLNVIPDWGQRKKSGARTTKSKTSPSSLSP